VKLPWLWRSIPLVIFIMISTTSRPTKNEDSRGGDAVEDADQGHRRLIPLLADFEHFVLVLADDLPEDFRIAPSGDRRRTYHRTFG